MTILDNYSKWPEVIRKNSTAFSSTNIASKSAFDYYGYPLKIVAENEPQSTSSEFSDFISFTRCWWKTARGNWRGCWRSLLGFVGEGN